MRRLLPVLLAALASAALSVDALAAQEVDGLIVQARSKQPVPQATVTLADSAGAEVARAVTRRDGRFRLRAPAAGVYRLQAEVEGRGIVAAGEVVVPADVPAEVTMFAGAGPVSAAAGAAPDSAIALAPVEAVGEVERQRLVRNGYYDRKRTVAGTFLSGAQFGSRPGARLADAINGLQGATVYPAGGGGFLLTQHRMGRRCMMSLVVDGILQPGTVLTRIRREDVEAVEVYSGSSVPVRFRHPGAQGTVCGAVVIWLKVPVS